jgi:hypothetical protein
VALSVRRAPNDDTLQSTRHEWAREVHLNHRQQTDPLLGLAIGIDDGLFDEFIEPTLVPTQAG